MWFLTTTLHYGYVGSEIDKQFDSEAEAEAFLIKKLTAYLAEHLNRNHEDEDGPKVTELKNKFDALPKAPLSQKV